MLLLIRTPLARLTWIDLGVKELLGPLVLRCLFPPYGPYLRSPPRGPLGGLGTSSSGTQTPCGLAKRQTSYGGAFTFEIERAL